MRAFRSLVVVGLLTTSFVGLLSGEGSAWSVSIDATARSVLESQTITVTLAASSSLQGTGYELRLVVDGVVYNKCWTTPCVTKMIYADADAHLVRGELWGDDPNCGRSATCVVRLRASSDTITLSWTSGTSAGPTDAAGSGTTVGDGPSEGATSPDGKWNILFKASFAQANVGEGAILSVSLDRPLGDTGFRMRIVDATTGEVLAECEDGTTCVGSTTSEAPASISYRAELVRPDGSTIVQTDPIVLTWTSLAQDPVSGSTGGGGGFPIAVILFVGLAAIVVGGLITWAFRSGT